MTILQWNIRSLNRQYGPGLKPLIDDCNPQIICLQETKLSSDFHIQRYKDYPYKHQNNLIAAGGTSIYVRNDITCRPLEINTQLQATAIRISAHRPFTICSIYLPPGAPIRLEQLLNLHSQLPTPLILLGDFNAHNPLWEKDSDSDVRGKIVEDFLTKTNLCLLNDTSPTYLDPRTFRTTSVDLTLCSPEIAPDFSWTTMDDPHHSDHFPIQINPKIPSATPIPSIFNTKRANWTSFQTDCSLHLGPNKEDQTIEGFTQTLLNISEKNIPKLSTKPRKNKVWFDNACLQAIREKRNKLQKAIKNPTLENIQNFRKARAKSRIVCRQAKKNSFQKYISKINSKTPMSKIWKIVNKLKGTQKDPFQQIKKLDGSFAESEGDVAEELAKSLSKNSSSSNYNSTFSKFKQNSEKQNIDFTSTDQENYNDPFTINELENSISELSFTAPGPDGILNEILSHLPTDSKILLLQIFNTIWQDGTFPDEWRKAIIIPIPKPGKNHQDPSNYRPIALTSCLCKLIEKMVNKRLLWYLETEEKLSRYQCGFRKSRSTLDHLVRLETFIREAFINKEHVTAVFFYLEKAFDTTWKHGILKDLYELGLKGNLPNFIKSFLNFRSFQVKVGSHLSEFHEQEEGVPQGSVLSPILFEIKINSITKMLKENIDCSLYVDDFLICYRSKARMDTHERQLQLQLNKLENWANQNGFKFSPTKTKTVHFCLKTTCVKKPELKIYNKNIQSDKQARFLGLIFDQKLTFLPHMKDLKVRCKKALNALKIFCSPEWGGDTNILLQLYRSLIRSKLDYGCQIYGSARKSYTKILDPIQNQGLRLALGAYRTSPEKSLHVEANELPLELRRRKLSLQYAVKISSLPTNPAYDCIFNIPSKIINISSKNNSIKPFGMRVAKDLKDLEFEKDNTENYFFPAIPLWELKLPKIDLSLTEFNKSSTQHKKYRDEYYKTILSKYEDHVQIFTDGSKSNDSVASAAIPMTMEIDDKHERLKPDASIFSAEAKAIDLALNMINKSSEQSFLILTDSLSCVKAIQSYETPNPQILNLKLKIHSILQRGVNITFLWIPSHVGIDGNDMADEYAKEGLNLPEISKTKVIHKDYRQSISNLIHKHWEADWNAQTFNKLHEIQPKLSERKGTKLTRKNSVIYTRLKIGHSKLTHQYLVTNDEIPFCVGCQKNFTIKHILTECLDFRDTREKYYRTENLKTIFDVVSPEKVLNYLKEINIYNKI